MIQFLVDVVMCIVLGVLSVSSLYVIGIMIFGKRSNNSKNIIDQLYDQK